jgi:hypothetical protein
VFCSQASAGIENTIVKFFDRDSVRKYVKTKGLRCWVGKAQAYRVGAVGDTRRGERASRWAEIGEESFKEARHGMRRKSKAANMPLARDSRIHRGWQGEGKE